MPASDCFRAETDSLKGFALAKKLLDVLDATRETNSPATRSDLVLFCYKTQRVTYMLRSSPAFTALEEMEAIDYFLLRCAESCLNVRLSSLSGAQLQLSVRLGGLGLRSSSSLALLSFIGKLHKKRWRKSLALLSRSLSMTVRYCCGFPVLTAPPTLTMLTSNLHGAISTG